MHPIISLSKFKLVISCVYTLPVLQVKHIDEVQHSSQLLLLVHYLQIDPSKYSEFLHYQYYYVEVNVPVIKSHSHRTEVSYLIRVP